MNATDDAYNKSLKEDKAGTLMGNWFEERVLRSTTGEGRNIPRKHRQPPKDSTFDRCYGHRVYDQELKTSKEYGRFFVEGNRDFQAQQLAEATGPRLKLHQEHAYELAEEYVQGVEAACMPEDPPKITTNQGLYPRAPWSNPDTAMISRSDVKGEIPVEVDVGSSYYTESVENTLTRANVKRSAETGYHYFGKNTQFSRHISEFPGGAHKDEEDMKMFAKMEKNPRIPTDVLCASYIQKSLEDPTSLVGLKKNLMDRLIRRYSSSGSSASSSSSEGRFGIAQFRNELNSKADVNGYVAIEYYAELFGCGVEDCQCGGADSAEQVERNVDTRTKLLFWLDLIRVNQEVQVYKFMESFRPSVNRENVKAVDDLVVSMTISEMGHNITNAELKETWKGANIVDPLEAKCFWYDIAAFNTCSQLKALFPVKEGAEGAVEEKKPAESTKGAVADVAKVEGA